jgi:coatomer subunit beta
MDVLQVLSSADMEVRRKAMAIVLSMTSSRNVEEVVLFLKKQLLRTQEQDFEKVRHGFFCNKEIVAHRRMVCVGP